MEIIKPLVHETIWGGSRLSQYANTDSKSIGHLYSVIDSPELCSPIVEGAYKGRTIHEWFLANREKYGLGRFDHFPLTIALLDAAQDLSIQVHPGGGEQAGKKVEPGKNESFYVLAKPSGGAMWCGCKAESLEQVKNLISRGSFEEVTEKVDLEAGDYIYIPGGTLHAATAGGLYFEVEENSGKTYRFYDYDRLDSFGNKRPLQIEQALACLDITSKGIKRKYAGWLEEKLYATRMAGKGEEIRNNSRTFYIAVPLKGKTDIDGQNILPGTAVLLEPGEKIEKPDMEWMLARPLGEKE